MRTGANILSPITVNLKYPPGTVVDYAYNVFYQVRNFNHVGLWEGEGRHPSEFCGDSEPSYHQAYNPLPYLGQNTSFSIHLVIYQREVDKGKLTAVASFEKLTFRA